MVDWSVRIDDCIADDYKVDGYMVYVRTGDYMADGCIHGYTDDHMEDFCYHQGMNNYQYILCIRKLYNHSYRCILYTRTPYNRNPEYYLHNRSSHHNHCIGNLDYHKAFYYLCKHNHRHNQCRYNHHYRIEYLLHCICIYNDYYCIFSDNSFGNPCFHMESIVSMISILRIYRFPVFRMDSYLRTLLYLYNQNMDYTERR